MTFDNTEPQKFQNPIKGRTLAPLHKKHLKITMDDQNSSLDRRQIRFKNGQSMMMGSKVYQGMGANSHQCSLNNSPSRTIVFKPCQIKFANSISQQKTEERTKKVKIINLFEKQNNLNLSIRMKKHLTGLSEEVMLYKLIQKSVNRRYCKAALTI